MVVHRIAPVPPLPTARLGEENVPEWTDQELLGALAAQDPRAGLVLYDRLIRVVEWTILRVTGQRRGDHEDLVQNTFEQIVSTLYAQRYAGDCSLTSWASAIGCHVALNALRAQNRQRSLHAESLSRHPESPTTDIENQVAARQALERIRIELVNMNPSRAEVLVLHEINGLELADIARVLGISITAAQSRLSRGRRELLERLGSRSEAGGGA
jgi:RNA polymerase sigma-70 factor, ECF subfamily